MAKKAAKSAAKAEDASEVKPVEKPTAKPASRSAAEKAPKKAASASASAAVKSSSTDNDQTEQRTLEIGRELFGRVEHRSPSIFHGRWWEDRLMSWAMNDEAVKVQMFRFVDVLPMLRDHTTSRRVL
jgi:hypothetical protein